MLGTTIEITIGFRRGIADRYLDSVVLPLHYEIIVNVFRTRPRHLVKFQSSRPIVAVRADSGNYRPIKPPLRPPDPSILLRFRIPVLPQPDTLPGARSHLSTSTISGIRRAPDSARQRRNIERERGTCVGSGKRMERRCCCEAHRCLLTAL